MAAISCATNAPVFFPSAFSPLGSNKTLSHRYFSGYNGVKLKPCTISFKHVNKAELCVSKCRLRIGEGNIPKVQLKIKPFKISSFNGSTQNDESESRIPELSSCKTSVQVPFPVHHIEATARDFSEQEISESYVFKNEERGFVTYIALLEKWLVSLQTQSFHHNGKDIGEELKDNSVVTECKESCTQKSVRSLATSLWYSFLTLDLAIKVPLMLFIPGYLALNLIYGAEISRQLTPLWVLGPLIVAVYIKLLQALCALSIYSIKHTIGLVKNIPNYFKAICGLLRDHLWHSVVSILTLDYRVLLKQKLRQLQEVAYEKYLDLIESVWPYYCPTIRALKKALLL